MIKRIFPYVLSVFVFLMATSVVQAATLGFTPATSAPAVDGTISVGVTIDAGTSQVAGTDIYITYDKNLVSVQSVTNGDYFALVNNIPSDGRLYISGVVANPGEFKTGSGTVATVVFKALATGTAQLTYDCDLAKVETSKIVQNDVNASNIINCSALGKHTATIAGGGSGSGSSSPSSPGTKGGTLPESGVLDNAVQYSSIGILLLVAGIAMKLLLRV